MTKKGFICEKLAVFYCLLKAPEPYFVSTRRYLLSQKLYETQDFYERYGARQYANCFIIGNRDVKVLPSEGLWVYDRGVRMAMDEEIERYSIGDVLTIAAEIVDQTSSMLGVNSSVGEMSHHELRLVIIGDYELQSDELAVNVAKNRLNELKGIHPELKVCYIDTEGMDRSGILRDLIDRDGMNRLI